MKGKKYLRNLALFFAALFLLPAAGCDDRKPIVQTELSFTQMPAPSYGNSLKREKVEKLHTAVGNALQKVSDESIANVWKKDENAKTLLLELSNAFEKRGVSAKDFSTVVDTLCEKEELFLSLLPAPEGETSPSMTDSGFSALFGEISSCIGIAKTAQIGYDFAGLYCEYERQSFTDKYNKNGFDYLRQEANEWKRRKGGVERIGESNFTALMRLWLGGASVLSLRINQEGNEGTMSSSTARENDKAALGNALISMIYPGEVALYLRAQGTVLQGLKMTEENYAFAVEFFGEVFKVPVCAAIVRGKKQAAYAEKAQAAVDGLCLALLDADERSATLLMDGKINEGIRSLFYEKEVALQSCMDFFTVENAPAAYNAYLKSYGLKARFESYENKKERGFFEQFFFDNSPQLAFLVFGL